MRFNALLALLALAAGTSALAQQTPPATPAATAAAPAEVPRHKCAKPGPIPGENTSTDRQMLQYSKDYKEYTDCLKTFALAQQKLAEPQSRVRSTRKRFTPSV